MRLPRIAAILAVAAALRLLAAAPPATKSGAAPLFPPATSRGQSAESAGKDVDTRAIEAALIDLINEERARGGAPPVRPRSDLTAAARAHSAEMASTGILSHESPGGGDVSSRLVRAGAYFAADGENVSKGDQRDPAAIHNSFMASPGHRKIILDPEFDALGVGVVVGPDGRQVYITEDFVGAIQVLSAADAAAEVRDGLRAIRAEAGAPPLSFRRESRDFAMTVAARRFAGEPQPSIPRWFGTTRAFFLEAPRLSGWDEFAAVIRSPDVTAAAVGVKFGRRADHPGGVYVVAILLFSPGASDGRVPAKSPGEKVWRVPGE